MNQSHRQLYGAALAVALSAGCAGSVSDELQVVASELTAAQCTFAGDNAVADACFTAFDACKAADGAVIDDCKATLKSCLPPPPDRGQGRPHQGGGDCRGGKGDGGVPGGDRDDRAGGPPPRGQGEGHGGPGGGQRGGAGGIGGHRPVPDEAAVSACHDALSTCLEDPSTTSKSCFDTERGCIHAAFDAAFQARCDEVAVECANGTAPADACAKITERCAAGVSRPPRDADGGLACQAQ